MVNYDGAIFLPSTTATASSNPLVLPTLALENTPQTLPEIGYHQHQLNILDQPKSINSAGDRPSSSPRPRGRPPGSKNKPKSPLVLPLETEPFMKTVVLQVASGFDVVDAIAYFTRRQPAKGFIVMSASGSISDVTLLYPETNAPSISLPGPLNILSLTGTYYGSYHNHSETDSCFRITVDANQGQVCGGVVGGKLIAASPVLVIGSTFMNSMSYRLPCGTVDNVDRSIQQIHVGGGGGGSEEGGFDHQNPGTPTMTVYGVANPAPITTVTPFAPRP